MRRLKAPTGFIMTTIDMPTFKSSRFYRNCRRQRKAGAKICDDCPFREGIEQLEKTQEESCTN